MGRQNLQIHTHTPNSSMKNSITPQVIINEIVSHFQKGIDAWIQAGEKLVEAIETHHLNIHEIAENTGIPLDVLSALEKIGRHQLNPGLLIAEYPAARHMERLPLSEQTRLLEHPVEVLLVRDDGTDILRIQVRNMTSGQARQVFARDHVRPIDEQRAWIEAQRTTAATEPKRIDLPYTINQRRGCVLFRADVEVSQKELLRIITQLQD